MRREPEGDNQDTSDVAIEREEAISDRADAAEEASDGDGRDPSARRPNPEVEAAIKTGTLLTMHTKRAPDRLALVTGNGEMTFDELNKRCNKLARALRTRGLKARDSLAFVASNRPEFAEVLYACVRSGIRVTPVNWHLTGEEIAYIVDDCDAKAFVADAAFSIAATEAARLAPSVTVRLAFGGDVDGFESYEDALKTEDDSDIPDPVLGGTMLYTSGTTGRPKGVHRDNAEAAQRTALARTTARAARYDPETDRHICTGPLYHAAPLAISLRASVDRGVGCVVMEKWDSEEFLRLVEKYGVTHTHLVPTMFHRLLQLPEETRSKYDVSSLRYIVHGAAPCPVHVKQAMMDWLGPVIYEYYAATEGGGTFVTPEEWLERPGTVGKPREGVVMEVWDEDGKEVPNGTVGTIFIKAPERGRFEYFKDPEKTNSAYRGDFFTLGDMGQYDDEGYLYLTGRSAEVIISGGVNIYPAEVDAVLLEHSAVADVATVGVPNSDMGEEVKSVVQLKDDVIPNDELAQELITFTRDRLAHYKCPRSIDFSNDLPRHDTGKIYRRLVRDQYWEGLEKKI